MKVYINQQLITDSKDIDSIIQNIEGWIVNQQLIITSNYVLNGNKVTGDWLDDIKINANTDARLELHTEDLLVVLKEMKDTTLDYVIQIEKNLPSVIDRLYTSEENMNLTDVLHDLIEGIEYLLNVAINLNFDKLLENHVDMLKELMETLELHDTTDCADLLKYEWLPWMERYKKELLSLELE
ncbi:hypothetical protein J2T56_001554 [Natronobacillus azotifigens]|uniref:Uncharacterized protein n=1 Tax=Natronobacillus azotifigens TaxID=472978 RepID=A0A9J6R908_9BACI|nr:hypothetical protein [Natronobacillus azotifigens]MCZ0702112.1 hypothetical protein [Natronobacillus azotifigens]